jgi:hypothetical protein
VLLINDLVGTNNPIGSSLIVYAAPETTMRGGIVKFFSGSWTNRNGQSASGSVFTLDTNGNAYAAGVTYNSGSSYDYFLVKYASNGLIQWTNRWDGQGYSDYPSDLTIDPLGNVVVTGNSRGFADNSPRYATVKFNANGTIAWSNLFGATDSYATGVACDNNGSIYVTGSSRTNAISSVDENRHLEISRGSNTSLDQSYRRACRSLGH